MKKLKPVIVILLCLFFFSTPIVPAFADGNDNADTGGGDTGGKVSGKGFYRSGEWMYKVSVYVGLWDRADTRTSISKYKMIGNEPIFVKPRHFTLPSGVIFGKHSKVDYLKGRGLESNNRPRIVTDNPPPPPITNNGTIGAVKNYFGTTKTLIGLIDAFAQQKGTTREGLVSNLEFTISGKKGRQNPKDILPVKGADGKYKNKVPWVIIYEPVTIAYLKDGKTKLAFTATEYALAQKSGLWNFFYSPPSTAQWIAGMTHANLPNSVVLEKSWFGFKAYPATRPKEKWSDNRIINGGGWGMRFLEGNGGNLEQPIYPPEGGYVPKDQEYRVDTDVITSFWIAANNEVSPKEKAVVTFTVDGKTVATSNVVMPKGGSQLVWAKWHTPKKAGTVNIKATISGNKNIVFVGGKNSVSIKAKIIDLTENEPPDTRAKDPDTGKPVEKPKGYKIPGVPNKANNTSAVWGEWAAYWQPHYEWKENWVGDVDKGEWVEEGGHWEYVYNSYKASLNAKYNIKPDEHVPTAKQFYSRWEMKSGYGINIEVDPRITTDAPSSDIAVQGNVINYFPEFNYGTYWRVSERMKYGKHELKVNKYSTYGQRVHFTPLWFPDGKYTPYSELIDIWTPAGMLSVGLDDYIEINGNVFDDWTVVPVKP